MYRVCRSDPPVDRGIGYNNKYRRIIDFRLSRDPDEESILSNKIDVRPATAKDFFQGQPKKFSWKRGVDLILAGTHNKDSPLNILRGYESTLVRYICSYLTNQFDHHVKLTIPAALVGKSHCFMHFIKGRGDQVFYQRRNVNRSTTSNGFEDGFVSFAKCGRVHFPDPADRNVNMMPFIFGKRSSLPDDLKCYHPLIEQCPYMKDEVGKVGYLTVHESYIDVGEAQRREGLHIEAPDVFNDDPHAASFTPGTEHHWGCGAFFGPDRYEGGIYFASSVTNTSQVWDALVDKNAPGIVDKHGGCEHLRSLIGNGTKLDAGELIWMTDCTPHEALPQESSGYRQFFRVVTPYVSHWYANHSTYNPKVPLPPSVTVIFDDKFAEKVAPDVKAVSHAVDSLGVVDPEANIDGDIFRLDDDPADVMLAFVDPAKNIDNFFILQIITLVKDYVVYTRWGRTGDLGQSVHHDFDKVDDAIKCFKTTFEEKTGLTWENRGNPMIGDKYRYIKQNFGDKRNRYEGAKWQYWVDDGVDMKAINWYDYTATGSIQVEQLYQEHILNGNLPNRLVKSGYFEYSVNLIQMTQTNINHTNRTTRRIRRVAKNLAPA